MKTYVEAAQRTKVGLKARSLCEKASPDHTVHFIVVTSYYLIIIGA